MHKKYFHLAAVKVVFQDPADQRIGDMEFNIVFPTDDGQVLTKQLNNVQRQAQMRLFQAAENPNLIVADVFIYHISLLAHATPEDFTERPVVEEVDPAPAAPVDATEALLNMAANQKPN